MPVTGTPTSPVVVSTDQIRMFLRDKAENNILLDTVQFTQAEVDTAVSFACDAYNAVSPPSNVTPSSFPNRYVLLIGTAKYLMQSESFMQIRNQASIQDGGIAPIGISDKVESYSRLAQLLKAEFDELVRGLKTYLNMAGAYNSLGSGYRNISRRR